MNTGFRGFASVAVAVVLLGGGAPAPLLASSDLGAYWSLLERHSGSRGMLHRILNALDAGEVQPPSRPTRPARDPRCPRGGRYVGRGARSKTAGVLGIGLMVLGGSVIYDNYERKEQGLDWDANHVGMGLGGAALGYGLARAGFASVDKCE